MTQPIRLVLAARLRELMAATPALDTQAKLGAASSIAQSTVGRILRGEVGVTLDNVEALASAFEKSPSALLSTESEQAANELLEILGSLPTSEASKVLGYAQFVASQYSRQFDDALIYETESSLGGQQSAIQEAAAKPLKRAQTMSVEVDGKGTGKQGRKRELRRIR